MTTRDAKDARRAKRFVAKTRSLDRLCSLGASDRPGPVGRA